MLIDTTNTVKVSGNVEADGTMSLDQDGMAHLISILTNLYSDKYLAVLREYSTNARDAHIAAGNPDLPVRVTLPSVFNQTLVISDQGTGLSREELLGIYSRYGASSKRNTNTQVGSFGLGSKSAFTIGGQFIVTARKDGQQTSAVFAMNSSGVGTVNILAEHETTEPNGTTVSIAVSEPSKMQEAAKRFFQAWRPGTVLVDGEEPTSYYTDPEALWLSDTILYTRKGNITVSMGSVAYPLPYSAVQAVRERTGLKFPLEAGLLVEVPIGAVDITPSREGIRDTERSLQAIAEAISPLADNVRARLSEITGDEITRVFAARKLLQAAEHLKVSVSNSLPAAIRMPPGAATNFYLSPRGGLQTDDLTKIDARTAHLITVLVGVPSKRSAKRHAKAWIEENSSRRMLIMFADGNAVSGNAEWFRYGTDVNGNVSPVETVHFDDIELPAAERSSSARNAITYSTYAHGVHAQRTPSEIKALNLPVAYGAQGSHPALTGYLSVSLTSRQSADVFLRRVPSAVPTAPLIKAYNDAQLQQLGDITDLAKGYYLGRVLERMSYKWGGKPSITHPAYLAAQRSAAAFNALTIEQQLLVRTSATTDEDTATASLRDALPLLFVALQSYGDLSAVAKAHLIAYANA